MSEIITSLVNPRVKRLIRLREKRARERAGVILVEGYPEIDRFLETDTKILECYFCPQLMKDKAVLENLDASVEQHEVTQSVFTKLAYGHRMEGVLFVAEKPKVSLENRKKSEQALFVAVEHVEKPGNLGAIFRSCDGAGVDAVLVCDPKVDIYNANVIRASLGTVFTQCVVTLNNEEALEFLKKNKVSILAASPGGSVEYTNVQSNSGVCLVVGAEDAGLSSFWLDHADQKLRIPMFGRADSLNVSVTTAVLLYEILRQRNS